MRTSIIAGVGALVGSVTALPQGNLLGLPLDIATLLKSLGPAPASDPRFTNFKPAGSGDVRSPCPGLNALANHNFIPHNGRNNTIPVLIKGLAEGMNMGADFTVAIGGAGLLASPNPLGGSFDLDDLNMHNFPIEHDASMSRQDAALGNDQPFYNPNWQQYISFFDGKATTDVPTASKAKFARYNDSLTKNPAFTYGIREAIFSYGENAIYLQAMSDPVTGKAQVSYVKSLFEQEKLPFNLGWRPSTLPITLPSLGAMVVQLYGNSPQPIPEGAKILADSYKDALVAVAGGSQILANLTQGISSALGL
ncbi:Cloroperoxidase [Dothidotthia symphoricarpi CBS 119687]|uniref:Cloroperoxidase n=1 Tax=Dothidotthia symphoricarpi CBS 119687 TaxID=1392245 RepID=A0A6A6AL43_9PLEO|nr:Cloroperoxidase [Dothidotthia symphoricarpi CBS 119687]KAF2131805.1 Cloroperoxidase [Dothidotthia symphoricarpi CBS 119687]